MEKEYLDKLKDEQRHVERSQSKLLVEYLRNQDRFWEFQGLQEQIAFDKNQNDMILISEQLFEWSKKAKNPEQKKLLDDLFMKMIRVSSYVFHLETVSKHSVTLYYQELDTSKRMLSEKRTLQLKMEVLEIEKNAEIKALKSEIEFINSNNK